MGCSEARIQIDSVSKAVSYVEKMPLAILISEKKRKTTQTAKSSSHQLRKRGHLGRKALHQKKKGGQ